MTATLKSSKCNRHRLRLDRDIDISPTYPKISKISKIVTDLDFRHRLRLDRDRDISQTYPKKL